MVTLFAANERRTHLCPGPSPPRGKFDDTTGLVVARSATVRRFNVVEFARASERARVKSIIANENVSINSATRPVYGCMKITKLLIMTAIN